MDRLSPCQNQKKNVIDPQSVIEMYGADAVRWFVLSDSPPERDIQWSDEGISGSYKFIQKIWNISERINSIQKKDSLTNKIKNDLNKLINKLIKEVTYNIDHFHFNVAVAKFYEFINSLSKILSEHESSKEQYQNIFKQFLVIIYPFLPHLASECWERITQQQNLHIQSWPTYDENLLKVEEINLVIQINGKKRAILKVKPNIEEKTLFDMSLDLDNVKKFVENKKIVKKIYVKNKLINFVIAE